MIHKPLSTLKINLFLLTKLPRLIITPPPSQPTAPILSDETPPTFSSSLSQVQGAEASKKRNKQAAKWYYVPRSSYEEEAHKKEIPSKRPKKAKAVFDA